MWGSVCTHTGPFNWRKWSAHVFHHCSWLRECQAACLSDERHVSDASLGPSPSRVPHMETQVGGSSENMRRCRIAIVVPPPPPHHKVNTRTAPFTQGWRAQRPRPPLAQRPRAEQDIPSILGFMWNEKDMFPFLFVSETRHGPLCLRRNWDFFFSSGNITDTSSLINKTFLD